MLGAQITGTLLGFHLLLASGLALGKPAARHVQADPRELLQKTVTQCEKFSDPKRKAYCFQNVLAVHGEENRFLLLLNDACAAKSPECYSRGIEYLLKYPAPKGDALSQFEAGLLLGACAASTDADNRAACYVRGVDKLILPKNAEPLRKLVLSSCTNHLQIMNGRCLQEGLKALHEQGPRIELELQILKRVCRVEWKSPMAEVACFQNGINTLTKVTFENRELVLRAAGDAIHHPDIECLRNGVEALEKVSEPSSCQEGATQAARLIQTICSKCENVCVYNLVTKDYRSPFPQITRNCARKRTTVDPYGYARLDQELPSEDEITCVESALGVLISDPSLLKACPPPAKGRRRAGVSDATVKPRGKKDGATSPKTSGPRVGETSREVQ